MELLVLIFAWRLRMWFSEYNFTFSTRTHTRTHTYLLNSFRLFIWLFTNFISFDSTEWYIVIAIQQEMFVYFHVIAVGFPVFFPSSFFFILKSNKKFLQKNVFDFATNIAWVIRCSKHINKTPTTIPNRKWKQTCYTNGIPVERN